jgi:hypothetical protein
MKALVSCQLRPSAVMQQVAVLQPLLLKLGTEGIQQRVQLLQEICAGCGYWQQQLQDSLEPELLGHALMRIIHWHRRLMFIVQNGMSDRLQLSEVLLMSRRDFEKHFAFEYAGWKLEEKQKQLKKAAAAYSRHSQTSDGLQQQQQQQRLAWLQQQQQVLQRQQQRQQQQPQAKQQQEQQLDQFVNVLQALAGGGRSTATVGSSSSSNGIAAFMPDPQEQQQQQQWQQRGEGDEQVYYLEEDEWQQESSSSSSQQGYSQQYDSQTDASIQHPDAFQPGLQLRQQSMQLIESGDDDDDSAHVHMHVPLLFKSDMQLLAVQQSALELYGSWEGSLVRPTNACDGTAASRPACR